MRRRAVTWSAWLLATLPVVLLLCGSLLSVAANSVGTGFSYDSETLFASAISVATLLPFPVVGAIVAARHPRNAIGWIFCGVGVTVGLNSFAARTFMGLHVHDFQLALGDLIDDAKRRSAP